jgi:hypothetical protein
MAAVTGFAGRFAQSTVHASRHVRNFVSMAGRALNLRNFGRVRIVLDGRVAVGAAQDTVHAGGVFTGVNRNALAAVRLHSRLAVAGKAAFILLERLNWLRLSFGSGICWGADWKKTECKKHDQTYVSELHFRMYRGSHLLPQVRHLRVEIRLHQQY